MVEFFSAGTESDTGTIIVTDNHCAGDADDSFADTDVVTDKEMNRDPHCWYTNPLTCTFVKRGMLHSSARHITAPRNKRTRRC